MSHIKRNGTNQILSTSVEYHGFVFWPASPPMT